MSVKDRKKAEKERIHPSGTVSKQHRSSCYGAMFCWETLDPGILADSTWSKPTRIKHNPMKYVFFSRQCVQPNDNKLHRTMKAYNVNLKILHIWQNIHGTSLTNCFPWRPHGRSELALNCQDTATWPPGCVPVESSTRVLTADPLSPGSCKLGPRWIGLAAACLIEMRSEEFGGLVKPLKLSCCCSCPTIPEVFFVLWLRGLWGCCCYEGVNLVWKNVWGVLWVRHYRNECQDTKLSSRRSMFFS